MKMKISQGATEQSGEGVGSGGEGRGHGRRGGGGLIFRRNGTT